MKTKRVKLALYVGLLIAILALMAYLYTKGKGSTTPETITRDWPEIKADGKLRLLAAYNALDYKTNEAEGTTGEVYELAKKLKAYTGLDVEVVLENRRDLALEALRMGQVDLIATPLVLNSSLDTLDFSWVNVQVSAPIYLVQKKDTATTVTSQLELADKVITLPRGSELAIFVQHLSEEIGDSIHIKESESYDTEQIVMQVANSDVDYTLASSREAKYYQKVFPSIDASLPISYSLRRVWLVRKDAPILRDSLNLWLAR